MTSRQLKVTSVGHDFLKDQIGQKDTQIAELMSCRLDWMWRVPADPA